MRIAGKLILTGLVSIYITSTVIAQVIPIASAKAQGAGSTVTVSGILTNGSELGIIRYIQDKTGGLAIYSSSFASATTRGDSVTVTGTLKTYQNFLELDPVNNYTKHASGKPLPNPEVITPSQMGVSLQGQLVKILDAQFVSPPAAFSGNTNYNFTASNQTAELRISISSPLVGDPVPTGVVNLTGICGQFYDLFQLLLRTETDIVQGSSIFLTSAVSLSNQSQGGFTLSWETNIVGSTQAFYGHTPALEEGLFTGAGNTASHQLQVTGREAAEILYIQPFSVAGNDTARGSVTAYATVSASSGTMKAYFNRSVNNSVSLGTGATSLDRAVDDTLIAYINRAKSTIDLAIYNFDNSGISNITDALNNADDRGVQVRIVYDTNTDNSGVNGLNASITRQASPVDNYPFYGIMHNKFVIIDAFSTDPNAPILWTGSTNFTDSQINTDANNVIIIQDQSLAKAYTLEFNEMFGSDGPQPNAQHSRFGPDKTNNTPSEFLIDGERVECYFSPKGGVNNRIVELINTAEEELFIATMLVTRTQIAYAITDAKDAGANVRILVNSKSDCVSADPILAELGGAYLETAESGIMHHKYMIIDQGNGTSDPLVLTGSHNWSASAEDRNDENTLVVHDQTIANLYYQEFFSRYTNSGGTFVNITNPPQAENDEATTPENVNKTIEVLANDTYQYPVKLSLVMNGSNGIASLDFSQTSIIYKPNNDFTGRDTVVYKICYIAAPTYCDEASLFVTVESPAGTGEPILSSIRIYPNPAHEWLTVDLESTESRNAEVTIIDMTGRMMVSHRYYTTTGLNHMQLYTGDLGKGPYLVKIASGGKTYRAIMFKE